MSAFCPYDYVAAEVNPYPGRIVGREVKSIAGNSGRGRSGWRGQGLAHGTQRKEIQERREREDESRDYA